MIIRLSGADFSKNNLGQIQFNRELAPETLTLLSKYSKPLTEEKQFAVQDFIDGLKANGIWSQIKNLYLPILAGNLSETIFNVKTGLLDATPNSTHYNLTASGGVKCVAPNGSSMNVGDTLSVLYSGSQQNAHALVYNVENLPGTLTYNEVPIMGALDTLVFQLSFNTTGAISGKLATTIEIGNTAHLFNKTPSLQGFVSRTSESKIIGTAISGDAPQASADNPYTNFPVNLFKPTSATRPSLTSYGLTSMGASLTNEQITAYRGLADTFMNSMGVITTP